MEDITEAPGPLARAKEKLASWAPGPNPLANTPDEAGRVAGFWLGLWHGFIAPVQLVRTLRSKDVHIYEVHNSGTGYIFGFILGVMLWSGGGRAGGPRRRT
jgi:hypothetical protein